MSDLTTSRRTGSAAALVGGTLWALLPVAARLVGSDEPEPGTIEFVAVVSVLWVFLVAPPLLMLLGLPALRAVLGPSAGRAGAVGAALAAAGLAAMAAGNGIEMASISAGGEEVPLGHALFLGGVLVSAVGGIVLGIVLVRRCSDRSARAAGALLVLAFPLGLAIGRMGVLLEPEQDAWFWAAVSLPTGIAWVLIGRFLGTRTRAAVPAPAAAV